MLGWPWTFPWPSPASAGPFAFAPEKLWQPVNPGWSFGNIVVNAANSSAPEVEGAVLARQSYGRQIGRLMDAVEVLSNTLRKSHPSLRDDPCLLALDRLAEEVRDIKEEANEGRLSRLEKDLEALKASDPAAWRSLVDRQR